MNKGPFFLSFGVTLLALLGGCAQNTAPERAGGDRPAQQVARATPAVAPGEPANGIFPSEAPSIFASSAIMIDARTGRVLYYKNPDNRRAVASTQKLLTGLLVVERGGLDQRLTVASPDTWVVPTKLGIRPGEQYSRRQLLTAFMVNSSNDAAAALARDHSGSSEAFARAMNRRARELGAMNSNFRNPHGLTEEGQYSTARDIARIAYRAYREPELRQTMLMPSYAFRHAGGRTANLRATNRLLERSNIFNGMKTGYTNASGRCLVTSARWPGGEVIVVQLGSQTRYIFDDAEKLVRWQMNRTGGRFAEAREDAPAPAEEVTGG